MKKMSVREIEHRMVDIYQTLCREDKVYQATQRIEELKQQRWRLMRDSFEWTDENISRLEQKNERLKEALLDMRKRTIEVYESLNSWCTPDKNLYVKGTLWVEEMSFDGWEQDEDMEANLCDILCSILWLLC